MVSSIASSTHSKARSKIVVRAEPTKPKLKKAVRFWTHRSFCTLAFNENWKSDYDTSLTYLFSILSRGSSQEEFTVGGGGARGYCDSEEIKDAMKECEGTRVLRLFLDTNSRWWSLIIRVIIFFPICALQKEKGRLTRVSFSSFSSSFSSFSSFWRVGLDGKKLEACYAQYGCDINVVTDHYARVAGLEKKSR